MAEYNLYCDESCHLENDNSLGEQNKSVMVLGVTICEKQKKAIFFERIRDIKKRYKFGVGYEAKWTKISQSNVNFYIDLVDYFFDSEMSFRALVAKDLGNLNHNGFDQTHDEWYYKMYYYLLNAINPEDCYNIYVDIKDNRGGVKVAKLEKVLKQSKYDFDSRIIKKIQIIRSHEVEVMQVTDVLIGALSFLHRGLAENLDNFAGTSRTRINSGKQKVIERIRERSKKTLLESTLRSEKEFNIFVWHPKINPINFI